MQTGDFLLLHFQRPVVTAAILFFASCAHATSAQAQSASSPSSAYEWSGEIGVASDYVGKGLTKSNGEASVFAGVGVERGAVYARIWASSADLPQGSTAEIITTLGYRTRLAGNGLNLSVINRDLPGSNPGVDANYFEFQADVSRRIGPVSTRLRLNYTPDGFSGTEEAWWIELNGAVALARDTRISAAVATRTAVNGAEYNAWNLGVNHKLIDHIGLDVRWYDTDSHHRGSRYEGRLVGAITLSF